MICEYCGKEHNGEYGSGRFCCVTCARGFSTKYDNNDELKIVKCFKCKKDIKVHKRSPFTVLCDECKYKKCSMCEKTIPAYNRLGLCVEHCHQDINYKLRISNGNKGKTGGYRKGGGRSKGGYYKGAYFDSEFEIEVAKFLEDNNIKWLRNIKRFYYDWNGARHYYVPDLFLPKTDQYLEPKGYWFGDKEERTRFAVKTNCLNWILLMQWEWFEDRKILLDRIDQST